MSSSLVLTVLGDDRPGLVEALAAAIAAHDGNWLDSRMARLAGKFAGILRVSVPAERVAGLERALAELRSRGLRIVTEPAGAAAPAGRAVRMELVGADHPGIVREISALLSRRGVNVEELHTGCVEAPHSAQPLFEARAALRLPPGVPLDDLRRELEAVASDLIVEIKLDEPPGAQGS